MSIAFGQRAGLLPQWLPFSVSRHQVGVLVRERMRVDTRFALIVSLACNCSAEARGPYSFACGQASLDGGCVEVGGSPVARMCCSKVVS